MVQTKHKILILFVLMAVGILICLFFLPGRHGYRMQSALTLQSRPFLLKTHKNPLPVRDKKRVKPSRAPFKSKVKQQKIGVSLCDGNPNSPDYVAKRLNRATGHDSDPCARIHLNLDF